MMFVAGTGNGGFGHGQGQGASSASCNPRKFSEKIALLTQRQAEDTAAFQEVMTDITSTRIQVQRARQVRSLGLYYGGFPSNVSQIGRHPADLQGQPTCGPDSGCSTRDPPMGEHGPGDGRFSFPIRPFRRHTDTSPYPQVHLPQTDTSPYPQVHLSPPSGTSWRRTNSDSALHSSVRNTSVTGGPLSPQHTHTSRSRHSVFPYPVPPIEENVLQEGKLFRSVTKSAGRFTRHKSMDISGINVSGAPGQQQQQQQGHGAGLLGVPAALSPSGSLPDLSSLHLPSPRSSRNTSHQGSSSLSSCSTGHLPHTRSDSAVGHPHFPLSGLSLSAQGSLSNPILQSSLSNPNIQSSLHSLPNSLSSASLNLSLSNPSLESSPSNQSLQSFLSNSSLGGQSIQSAASHGSYSSGIGGSRSCSSSSLSGSPRPTGQSQAPLARRRAPLSPLVVPIGGESRWHQSKQFSPVGSPNLTSITQGVLLNTSQVSKEPRPSGFPQACYPYPSQAQPCYPYPAPAQLEVPSAQTPTRTLTDNNNNSYHQQKHQRQSQQQPNVELKQHPPRQEKHAVTQQQQQHPQPHNLQHHNPQHPQMPIQHHHHHHHHQQQLEQQNRTSHGPFRPLQNQDGRCHCPPGTQTALTELLTSEPEVKPLLPQGALKCLDPPGQPLLQDSLPPHRQQPYTHRHPQAVHQRQQQQSQDGRQCHHYTLSQQQQIQDGGQFQQHTLGQQQQIQDGGQFQQHTVGQQQQFQDGGSFQQHTLGQQQQIQGGGQIQTHAHSQQDNRNPQQLQMCQPPQSQDGRRFPNQHGHHFPHQKHNQQYNQGYQLLPAYQTLTLSADLQKQSSNGSDSQRTGMGRYLNQSPSEPSWTPLKNHSPSTGGATDSGPGIYNGVLEKLEQDSYTGLHLTASQTQALSQQLGALRKEVVWGGRFSSPQQTPGVQVSQNPQGGSEDRAHFGELSVGKIHSMPPSLQNQSTPPFHSATMLGKKSLQGRYQGLEDISGCLPMLGFESPSTPYFALEDLTFDPLGLEELSMLTDGHLVEDT